MSRRTDRTCCDGQCQQGRNCPAFAPGVIDGWHGGRGRLRALWRWITGWGKP